MAEESGHLAEDGAAGLRKILSGVEETTQVMSQVARATQEQASAGQDVLNAINTTVAQANQVATATVEQAKAVQGVAQTAAAMRRTAQQVSDGMNQQSRAARDIIKAAQQTTGLAIQVRKSAAEAGTRRQRGCPGDRIHAARRQQHLACHCRTGHSRPAGIPGGQAPRRG